jgi:hypothetical protein
MMMDPDCRTTTFEETIRRLRVVFMCIVGYVGLWDVTATFGPGGVASELARRGDIPCNAVWSRDGQVFPRNDRCQSHAVAPFLIRTELSVCSVMCGQGETDLFVWLPGYTSPFLRLRQWRF